MRYDNPFSKAHGFYTKYMEKLESEGGNDKFWQEVVENSKYFNDSEMERKLYFVVLDALEEKFKKGNLTNEMGT